MPGPTFLEGENATLHTVEEDDIEFLQKQVNDPQIRRPIGRTKPINREQEHDFFENVVCTDDVVTLLIVADSVPVGMISLHPDDSEAKTAEIGYWIVPEHHNQGYGTEATELLVEYGFDQLGLHRIAARVFEFNEPSKRLLKRVGFTREGIHRETEFIDGEYQNTFWYGLLDHEWRAERS